MSSNKKLKVSRSTRYRRRLNAATLATTMLCDSSDDEPLATQLFLLILLQMMNQWIFN